MLSCGNGGSHCDAMHFAEELTGRYRENRPGYPAIAISDVSHISCVGNDFGFNDIFSRYVEAVGREGDVLLGISTSGNSANVIKAIAAAREKGMKVITLTGKDGGKMAGTADIEIRVPHFGYADRIQEIHIKVIHILIQLIEKRWLSKVFSPFQGEGRGEGNSLHLLLLINLRRGPCAPAVVEVTHVRIARDERQRPYRYLL